MPFSIRISIFCEPIQKRKTKTFRILFVVASRVFAIEQFGRRRWKANKNMNLSLRIKSINMKYFDKELCTAMEALRKKCFLIKTDPYTALVRKCCA